MSVYNNPHASSALVVDWNLLKEVNLFTASSWPVCTSPPFACSLFPNFYIVPDATLHLPSQCHEAGKVVKCKPRKPVTTKLKSPWH